MHLSGLDDLAVLGAGFLAGAVNSIVGSGSLLTFPTLLAIGYPSVVANVSNTVGITFGAAAGAVGYRSELTGLGPTVRRLLPPAVAGGVTGGILLLVLPAGVFVHVVPVLVLFAAVLVAVQPRLAARLRRRGAARADGGLLLVAGIYATGVYGGYFGAAQGVILLGLLGLLLPVGLQQANAVKNVLGAAVNGVAAVYFIAAAHVAWEPAGLIAVSSIIGAAVGSRYGKRLAPGTLRVVVAVVGTIVAVVLFVRSLH